LCRDAYFVKKSSGSWCFRRSTLKRTEITRNFRIFRRLNFDRISIKTYQRLYWVVFLIFFALMLEFIWPTINKSMTVMAIILVCFLVLTPENYHLAVLTFFAGSGLGFFLEYWGTTRGCWNYYTLAKPPLFAVLAHGMAAVAFWRTVLVLQLFSSHVFGVRLGNTTSQSR